MAAEPVDGFDPDDPVQTIRVLPARYHGQFLAEYDEAAASARRPEHYQELRDLLRLWRLRAVAYSDPDFEAGLEAARSGASEGTPVEDIVPGWAEKVTAARRRRAAG